MDLSSVRDAKHHEAASNLYFMWSQDNSTLGAGCARVLPKIPLGIRYEMDKWRLIEKQNVISNNVLCFFT